jgi:hypothetical protein
MTFQAPTLQLRYGSGSEAQEDVRRQLAEERAGTAATVPTFEMISQRYPAFAEAVTVFAAGSVVQGWAHANSDLDLYVVTEDQLPADDRLESFERRVSTEDPLIRIVLGEFGAFRADIEVWRAGQIDELIGRFGADTPSQEVPELDRTEQDMFCRLVSGRPLHGAAWWTRRRTAILESRYGTWVAENRKLTAEGYLEDVGGLLVSGDAETAVLAAHYGFTFALEALLASYGDYSVSGKWLYRRVVAAQPAEIDADTAWGILTMADLGTAGLAWAERVARHTQRLLLAVETRSR